MRQTPRHFSNSHPYSTKVKNNVLPPPPSIDKVDTIDLSKIPTVNTVCLWRGGIPQKVSPTFENVFHVQLIPMRVSCHLDKALNVEIGVEY